MNVIPINELTNSSSIKYKYIYYYKCKCRNNYNFGDMITQYIYIKLTNTKPINDINGGRKKEDVIIGAGSVIGVSRSNSIIWGTGSMFKHTRLIKPKKILSVRGPLTRKVVINNGYDCPEIYGDIGLILSYFYNPAVKKKFEIGIIPHYVDVIDFHKIFKTYDSDKIKVIDITDSIETVIDNVLSCNMIMSSSLHGIICAHAYNIPCIWIRITNKIAGGNFKYHDYYGSLNIKNYTDIRPYILSENLSVEKIKTLINEYPNPVFPIKTKHILELCPFITIKKT